MAPGAARAPTSRQKGSAAAPFDSLPQKPSRSGDEMTTDPFYLSTDPFYLTPEERDEIEARNAQHLLEEQWQRADEEIEFRKLWQNFRTILGSIR